MEDVDFLFESVRVTDKRSVGVYGVLDGHGGKECGELQLGPFIPVHQVEPTSLDMSRLPPQCAILINLIPLWSYSIWSLCSLCCILSISSEFYHL